MQYKLTSCVCAIAFLLLSGSDMSAQQQTQAQNPMPSSVDYTSCPSDQNPGKFEDDLLVQCREDLEKEIGDLGTKLGYLRDIRGYITELKTDKDKSKQEDIKRNIADREPWGGLSQGDALKPGVLEATLSKQELSSQDKTRTLRTINSEISRRLKAESFKSRISLYFALLVAVVIAGFFVIAYSDSGVKQEIFKERQGLQFITLFVLIIAIILFGITDVLQAKELAALLGGLAGYILGTSAPGSRSTGADRPKPEGGSAVPTNPAGN